MADLCPGGAVDELAHLDLQAGVPDPFDDFIRSVKILAERRLFSSLHPYVGARPCAFRHVKRWGAVKFRLAGRALSVLLHFLQNSLDGLIGGERLGDVTW